MIAALVSRFGGWVLGGLAAAGVFLGALAKAKQAGATAQRARQAQEDADAARVRADQDAAATRVVDPVDQLHDRWGR